MVNDRTARAVTTAKKVSTAIKRAPTNEPSVNPFDPDEPRTQKINGKSKAFKTIGMQFNRYEWWELEQAERLTQRSKNSIIREGIKKELSGFK